MSKPLNIVYILTDQHRFDMLGCYGHPLVRTPAIDAIAAQGVTFTHAFTPTSICGPARASLFTGRVPTAHGVLGNPEGVRAPGAKVDILPGIPGIPHYLPGYEKIYIGKWHVEESRLPRDFGFRGHNFSGYGFPGSGVFRNLIFAEGPEENRYAEWLQEKGFAPPQVSEAYLGSNPNLQCQELRAKLSGPAAASIPHFLVDEAETAITRVAGGDAPFFLWLNFWGPHTPCAIPEPYYSMYDPAAIPMESSFEETFAGKPVHHKHIAQMWGVLDLDWAGWAEIIARYFGYITLIDDCIGRLMSALERLDLLDRTIVVFASDHGDAMGAHKLIEKGEFMYDETYRIPLVARHPHCLRPGTTCTQFAYLHDLCPTAAEIATGQPLALPQARSLLPLIEGRTFDLGRDCVYGQFTRHFTSLAQRMLRTRTHKLVFNAPCGGELYDLEQDPHELTNRIDDPRYADSKRALLAQLQAEMIRVKDPLLRWFERIRDVY